MKNYPEGFWWVSFSDTERFRGVCVVRMAGDIEDVINHTLVMGCNAGPDTSVQAQWIAFESADPALKAAPLNRLMFEKELGEHGLLGNSGQA
jgi:hypothetical protein